MPSTEQRTKKLLDQLRDAGNMDDKPALQSLQVLEVAAAKPLEVGADLGEIQRALGV